MPLIRKIMDVGKTSKGITLPKSWLDFLEQKHGRIQTISMEVNEKLTIRPIIKEDNPNRKNPR